MNVISVVMLVFSVLGAIDYMTGNHFGIGKDFERGISLMGTMILSMVGMIVIAPLIAVVLEPMLKAIPDWVPFEPTVIAGSLLANDMGGAPLSTELALDTDIGFFNGLVVSSMMGATISFTIPVALGIVKKEQHKEVLLGLLCGIVTIPLGCFVSGLISCIAIVPLLLDLLPLVIFSGIIAFGLMKFPDACVKVFSIFGVIIKILITIGLVLGIFTFLTGVQLTEHLDTYENGIYIVANAAAVMTGAFPLVYIVSKLLKKPLKLLGKKMGINETAATGLVSTLATSMTTWDMIKDMDKKGAVLNSAFAVSAAFTFAGHLAFTLAFNAEWLPSVIIGKLVAGLLSLVVAFFIYGRIYKNDKNEAKTAENEVKVA
jgi:ethanolamine transporter